MGQARRALWLYRGARWRLIGRARKLLWFSRRRRRDVVAVSRQAQWAIRRSVGPVQGALRGGLRNPLTSSMSVSDHRRIVARIGAAHDEMVSSLGLQPLRRPDTKFAASARIRYDLFRRFEPAAAPVEQSVEIAWPLDVDRALGRRVSDSRFAVVDPAAATVGAAVSIVTALIISGRPVVMDRSSGAPEWFESLDCFSGSEEQLFEASEAELATIALAQLRQMVSNRRSTDASTSTDRPTVSVIMSTNRPDLVAAAVERIQSQRHVDVELLVGCHGFDASSVEQVELVGGAVRSAVVESFDADVVFGSVLAALSDRASHDWLSKWDDDDLYGPHHLVDLWLFAILSKSGIVGKAAEFVLLEERELLIRRRGGRAFVNSRFLAGGALMMPTDALRCVGNWASIPRSVDQNLIKRFESTGFAPFRIHGYEFVLVRHDRGHTWAASSEYFELAADDIRDAGVLDRVLAIPISAAERRVAAAPIDVTICVPNKDNADSVRLFERVASAGPAGTSLVVCDDRSDPPLALSPSADTESQQVVRLDTGEGFGAGRSRQRAASAASTELLVFADADMFLEADVLERVRARFGTGFRGALHGDISFSRLVGSQALESVESGGDSIADELRSTRIHGQSWRHRHWAMSADYVLPQSSTYRAAVGAFMAIDRTTFDNSGGFRDVPIRGVEDIEFGYRLLISGAEQRLERGGGIWHLGERTFADRLGPDEDADREICLSAHVPIWSRSLGERRAAVEQWDGDVVPFAWSSSSEAVGAAAETFGRGVLTSSPASSILDAPFALAVDLVADDVAEIIPAAFATFRNGRGGEVVVLRDGTVVGRFVALWALNLAARRSGDPTVHTAIPDPDALEPLIRLARRDFEMSTTSLD